MGLTFFGSVKYLGHVRSPLASHAGVFKNAASEARSPQPRATSMRSRHGVFAGKSLFLERIWREI